MVGSFTENKGPKAFHGKTQEQPLTAAHVVLGPVGPGLSIPGQCATYESACVYNCHFKNAKVIIRYQHDTHLLV